MRQNYFLKRKQKKKQKSSVNILPVAEELAKFFPQLDDADLNAVSVYTPMNTDVLDVDADGVFTFGGGSSRGDVSACLTPVSFGMDISMIANKGSMTLSVDVSKKLYYFLGKSVRFFSLNNQNHNLFKFHFRSAICNA